MVLYILVGCPAKKKTIIGGAEQQLKNRVFSIEPSLVLETSGVFPG